MRAWIIFGVVLLFLLLLSRLRLGGIVEWSSDGLYVQVRVGPLHIRVFPLKPKKVKTPRPEKAKKKKEEPELDKTAIRKKRGGQLALLMDCLPLLGKAVGRLKEKLRIDCLWLDLTVGSEDPADAVMNFGYANVALGMILPFFEHHFDLKDRRIRTAVDFELDAPVVYVKAALSYTLGQILALSFWLGISFLQIFLAWRKKQNLDTVLKQKEAVNHGK